MYTLSGLGLGFGPQVGSGETGSVRVHSSILCVGWTLGIRSFYLQTKTFSNSITPTKRRNNVVIDQL